MIARVRDRVSGPLVWTLGVVAVLALVLGVGRLVPQEPVVVVGIAAGVEPAIALLASVVACAVVLAVVYAAYLPSAFLSALGLLLVGYLAFGRGAAYVGRYPVFVGELVLAFGAVAVLLRGRPQLAVRSPVAWLLIAFGVCGAAQTFPYLRLYGTDALRDGVPAKGFGMRVCLGRFPFGPRLLAKRRATRSWSITCRPTSWSRAGR